MNGLIHVRTAHCKTIDPLLLLQHIIIIMPYDIFTVETDTNFLHSVIHETGGHIYLNRVKILLFQWHLTDGGKIVLSECIMQGVCSRYPQPQFW